MYICVQLCVLTSNKVIFNMHLYKIEFHPLQWNCLGNLHLILKGISVIV